MKYGFVMPYGNAADAGELVTLAEERAGRPEPYDAVVEGVTSGAGGVEKVRSWAEDGATWWIEVDWSAADPQKYAGGRLTAFPPRI